MFPGLRRPRRFNPVRRSRPGFTLIELLVAIVIFTILATLALSAFRESDQDRAAAGAQEFRSMLEGARSRAIHDGELRGVRLLLDDNDPNIVSSLVYIGAPRIDRGTVDLDWNTLSDFPNQWVVETANFGWEKLRQRGLILVDQDRRNTLRIHLGGDAGRWYTLIVPRETELGNGCLDGSDNLVRLPIAGHYEPSVPIPGGYEEIPVDGPVEYRLELAPPVLPGSVPRPLANGIAIDLAACKLPGSWNDGTTYSNRMDIMFTPRGDVTGSALLAGVLHFVIADLGDIGLGARYDDVNGPTDQRGRLLMAEKADRMVTLFPRTGLVTTSQLNHFDSTTGPYEYAFRGQDAP